jgi:two-component system cell cycle response regulator DivK
MPTVILYVEDIPDNANLVRLVLSAKGYEVILAADAETGLNMAIEHHPDLILLDLGLPDADGQTLASWLRNVPELAKTPIVALTAWPEETARRMVEAYGCNGYLSKPINVSKFPEQIAAYLR